MLLAFCDSVQKNAPTRAGFIAGPALSHHPGATALTRTVQTAQHQLWQLHCV